MPTLSRHRLLLAVVAALALLAAACDANTADEDAADEDTADQSAQDDRAVEEDDEEAYNEADVEFLQLMVPHHEEAVEMARMVEGRTDREELKDLADDVVTSQEAEIDEMTAMLEEAGAEPMRMEELHDGHGDTEMPGMMDPGEMEHLGDARDEEFDVRFAEMMIEHHEGAIVMAEDVLAQGQHPDVAELAEGVIEEQEAEIETMEDWLDAWR